MKKIRTYSDIFEEYYLLFRRFYYIDLSPDIMKVLAKEMAKLEEEAGKQVQRLIWESDMKYRNEKPEKNEG